MKRELVIQWIDSVDVPWEILCQNSPEIPRHRVSLARAIRDNFDKTDMIDIGDVLNLVFIASELKRHMSRSNSFYGTLAKFIQAWKIHKDEFDE